ncbi:sulfurtransferase complex subunit TusC [Histophilus somni]|uniref:sulfurtransferase complex subunit TusC n=2 Tax=Histophilus somni TaxID=731 RepID=UPI00003970F4|nr:sulfurtransferase complex subunit TusC [Histophilus somni]ACA31580.1 DsrE family protein [Histophilus somni 2336]QQF86189.1 sulfurtransferase complex subunit TusC [Histophilus somni]QQJ90007.1 sulfurtransferase complex subunit TusC [Histophilus somni]
MIKLAFIFRQAPHGSSISREGLDALLAATAFCNEDEIALFFLEDGVFNLLNQQKPEIILQKDFISTFKLLDLYEIEQRYICRQSCEKYQLNSQDFIISCQKIDRTLLLQKLNQAEKILTF